MSTGFCMRLPLLSAIVLLAATASAGIVAQWNFNSPVPDDSTSTGSREPSTGQGTASTLGGINDSFVTGDTSVKHDPAGSTDNSGWQTTKYPGAGSNNLTAGVQFNVDTTGYENISLSWYQRNTSTASRYARLQYTTDGYTFIDANSIAIYQDGVFTNQTADLGAVPGAANNPFFAFRIVTEFESTAVGGPLESFVATKDGASYGTSGTIRFDMVTVWGSLLPGGNTAPVIACAENRITLRTGQRSPEITLTLSDFEDDPSMLTVYALSSRQEVVADHEIQVTGEGSTRALSFTAGYYPGETSITINVLDTGGKQDAAQLLVTVLPLNTPPVLLSNLVRTNTLAGEPVSLAFSIGDLETPPEQLVVSASSGNDEILPSGGLLLNGTGSNRVLTITPAQVTGIAPVTVTVSDGSAVCADTFAVLVRASQEVVLDEPFAYEDGPVVISSAYWTTRSGTAGQCQVVNQQLQVTAEQTEDVVAALAGGPYARDGGAVLYASFSLRALSLPRAAPGLIAHFADASVLRGRLYVGATNALSPGTFRLHVSNGADLTAEFPRDLEPGARYRVVLRYDVSAAATRLWVDPISEQDESVDALDQQTAVRISSFGFRQDQQIGGAFLVDDLLVGRTFAAVTGAPIPSEVRLLGRLEGPYLMLDWPDSEWQLQSAGNPAGPFMDLSDAWSPWYVDIQTATSQFFRLERK